MPVNNYFQLGGEILNRTGFLQRSFSCCRSSADRKQQKFAGVKWQIVFTIFTFQIIYGFFF